MTDIVERLRGNVPMIWGDEGFMITDDDTVLATFKEAADEIERLREALAAMTELFEATEAVAQFGLSETEKLHKALAVIYRAHEKVLDDGEAWFITDDTTVGGYICSVIGAPPEEGK